MIKDAIANNLKRPGPSRFKRCCSRQKSRGDRSPRLAASACCQYTVPLFAQRRGQAETGSVPVRLQSCGTGGRKCGEDPVLAKISGQSQKPG